MKFTAILTSLLTAVIISALPSADPSPVNTISPLGGDSAADSEEHTLINRQIPPLGVKCYNSGTRIDRRFAIQAINSFCASNRGQTVRTGQTITTRYTFPELNGNAIRVLVKDNGCPNGGNLIGDQCGEYLRRPIDLCNTGGENGKQGGAYMDNCSEWRVDPGTTSSDN